MRVLFSEAAIRARVAELADELGIAYKGRRPLLLCTLTGAFIFTADLARALQPLCPDLEVDFVRASSYGAGTSAGELTLSGTGKIPLAGRHGLIVEDIVDTGATAAALRAACTSSTSAAAGAASVAVVALLDKKCARARAPPGLDPDYAAFECPDAFVVGYGLDAGEADRGWPFVGVRESE